ncbi:MAG: ArnT family glycosyltransferase [Thermodesulfobacteriota bacterium]
MTLPIAGGTFFIRWLLRSDAALGSAEALVFGMGLGLGFTASLMFILGLFRVPFTLVSAGLPIAGFTLIFFVLSRAGKGSPAAASLKGYELRGWRLYLAIVMALWIAAKTGFVFYESLVRPLDSVDSFINWAVSGKFFFYKAGLFLDTSKEHFFGRGYRFFIGHPLHLPLLQTWISLAIGRFHELYIKAPGALYFFGVIAVLYCGVKREAGPFYALLTAFFISTAPIFTAHGQDAYADLPLCFYALLGTVALWRFFRGDSQPYLVLSGIFFAMAIFVKNEGLFFAAAAGAVLLLYLFMRKRSFITPLAGFIMPFILIAGPWLLFKYYYGIGFGHSGASSGLKWFSDPFYSGKAGYGVHWEVLSLAFRYTFFTANYNLIFPLWIIAGITALRTIIKTELKYLYLMILFLVSMFTFVYLTLEVTAVTEQTGIHRNTLTYLPIVYFAAALALSRVWPDKGCES